MRQQLSLQFLKDLIDFNLYNKNFVIKSDKMFMNTLTVLHLNKEFKMFVNVVRHVITKKYAFIYILIEDPFLYQLLLKQITDLNRTASIKIVVSPKHRDFDRLRSKKALTINISNNFKKTTEDFMVMLNTQKTQNTGAYKVSSDIHTIKSLTFFIVFISNLLKIK